MFFLRVVFIAVCILFPLSVFAAGGHDGLVCTGCHSIHDAKGTIIFAVEANKKDVSLKTKQPFTMTSSLCLACHQTPEKGGMGIKPIAAHISHPYGLTAVDQRIARVPGELLRDGKFDCVGCHDPHPSNPNYKYLRVDTGSGSKMDIFCAVCHPMKTDTKAAASRPHLFNSMDERLYGTSAATDAETATRSKKKQ